MNISVSSTESRIENILNQFVIRDNCEINPLLSPNLKFARGVEIKFPENRIISPLEIANRKFKIKPVLDNLAKFFSFTSIRNITFEDNPEESVYSFWVFYWYALQPQGFLDYFWNDNLRDNNRHKTFYHFFLVKDADILCKHFSWEQINELV